MKKVLITLLILITLGIGVKQTSTQAYHPTYEYEIVNVRVIEKEGNFYTTEKIVPRFYRPYQFEIYSKKDYNINEEIYLKIYTNGDVEEWQNQ